MKQIYLLCFSLLFMACQGDAPQTETAALTKEKLTGEWLCVAGSIDGNSEDVLFVEDSAKQQAGARLKFLAEEQLDFALLEQFGLNNPEAYKIEDKQLIIAGGQLKIDVLEAKEDELQLKIFFEDKDIRMQLKKQ
ncbi:hypothetical protein [Saprospira grandis]|uniref:Lipocalin-like domain-containing protein n=1 Tax=Saprospira grandis (strain Lewin) TaxID=984262 RepID=H6L128_SAPGL|nr:hypothetical protein [Saprospira grandis]AFC26064.1 hypothetical protein SGRA_3337 [Saprospira grandis str. Lewin]WBM73968.1 hypothetical protein OP864_13330 [Saprospira grandis]